MTSQPNQFPVGEASVGGLLGPDDPQPFDYLNSEGAAPLLIVCDHASRNIPKSLDRLGLTDRELDRHIAWDIGAAGVTRRMAEILDAPAVLCGYSRLVVDCNRQPGDPTAIPPISDGTTVPRNQDLSEAAEQARTDAIFWPYHRAVGDALAHQWRRTPDLVPAFVSVHSFTPCMVNGTPRPWQIGLLWNRDDRMVKPVLDFLRAQEGLCVGDNEPYSGREIAYTTEAHAAAAGLPHFGIEIRQDLIDNDEGVEKWAALLASAIASVLGDPSLHRVVHY